MENNRKTIWKLDEGHSEISFKVKHMMISTVTGNFEKFEGSVETENENFKNAKFIFSAKTISVNTNNKDRDEHLRSDEFFGSNGFPVLTFRSTSFDGEKMVGELTIKDVTKQITLDVDYNGKADDLYGQTIAGFELEGEISRKDFGLNRNKITETGNVVVSDKVRLIASLQFRKQ